MPMEIPMIHKTERIIAIPSNNSPNFSYSNNVIRFQIPSVAGKIISPFKVPRLTCNVTHVAPAGVEEPVPPTLSPYIAFQSLIYQIQVSSTLKGVVLHTCRFYSRAVNTTEIDNYGYEEINRGSVANESASCYDYTMAQSGGGNKSALGTISIPLFTNVLDAPDMTSLDLAQLGGLSIEIQLNSNTSLFIDALAQGWTYSLQNVKLHYDLLTLMAPAMPGQREILFRCVETRADNIQSQSEYKSISINNSNVENVQIDAVPSAIQNSVQGDSFYNARWLETDTVTDGGVGNYVKADYTTVNGFVGVQEFREAVNGASVPIQQILNIPYLGLPTFTQSSIGLSNILHEDYKGSVKSGAFSHPRTLRNLYTYDNTRFIQGVGSSINPNPYIANTGIANAYQNGVIPIPKFSLGFLLKGGGSMLPESVVSYKFNSTVQNDAPMTLFHHIGLVKRILVGAGGELSVLN